MAFEFLTTALRRGVSDDPMTNEQRRSLNLSLTMFGLFVWLAAGTVHELFTQVPAPTYWQSVWLVLGWHTVTVIARPRSWKWARR